ncbi:MAG TPA: CBS domain-containing protein [Noviherbaspirillum sp.]|uniref:CBS domain-containing protein n=1 Tax=Noviherbaspirillum sp. TaxID=1926288 RepID=UPI002B48E5C1|nr:CBS domain-containing protein [Noviherbaspirillum sp.]HJV85343.1 CBS domain-containing protein [Noviherbaspirillum sp.]
MQERTVAESLPRKQLAVAAPQSSVFEAACIMTRHRCGSVLVIDPARSLIGIFTERDLMTKVVAQSLDPRTTSVVDVMTPNPQSIPPETKVSDALLLMKGAGFRHLPVVSEASGIVGVFSIRDALPHEIMEAEQREEFIDDEMTKVLG